jgi:diaminopimelate decarboxylase
VTAAKREPGGRIFVAVDGGTPDNPRATAGGSTYTVALANRHRSASLARATIVGRDWQAGSEIARDADLPADIHPGDLLAVACTGAYHHSMGSSRNLGGSPALVAVAAGQPDELVRRETVADLLARDRGWPGNPYPDRAATAS